MLPGEWVQVGLPPNPVTRYLAAEIGNENAAGQQGGYIGQQYLTGSTANLLADKALSDPSPENALAKCSTSRRTAAGK